MVEVMAEYGTIGVVVILFSYMVMNIIKSLKSQDEDLDSIRQHLHRMEAEISNSQSIVIKLIDRINHAEQKDGKRQERTNEMRSKSLERFGNRIERLERTTIRLEGRIFNCKHRGGG